MSENTNTAVDRDSAEILEEKLAVLKKNLDAVGREALKTKYANAYKNLLSEINELSNRVIHERIMILDLALVKESAKPQFAEVFNKNYASIRQCLLNADFVGYTALIESTAMEYALLWCENVERGHKEGEEMIFNPFTLDAETPKKAEIEKIA